MNEAQTTDSTTDAELAEALQALAHPVRLSIVRQLAATNACCNKDVVARVGLAQSTVSQHLKVLVDIGIVTYTPDSIRSRYSLNLERLNHVANALNLFKSNACSCFQENCCNTIDRKS